MCYSSCYSCEIETELIDRKLTKNQRKEYEERIKNWQIIYNQKIDDATFFVSEIKCNNDAREALEVAIESFIISCASSTPQGKLLTVTIAIFAKYVSHNIPEIYWAYRSLVVASEVLTYIDDLKMCLSLNITEDEYNILKQSGDFFLSEDLHEAV